MTGILHEAYQRVTAFRGLWLGLWWNVALLFGSLAAMPFDRRMILGLNPWVKPVKFEVSVIVFLFTVGLLMAVLADSGRWSRTLTAMGWGFGVAMIVENTVIAMQSARGVRSHMNYTSLFNGVSFGLMGVFIVVNTLLLAWLLVLFFRGGTQRPLAEIWGIRLGLTMILLGSIEGVLMVNRGWHTVGAEDGGPGLPMVNWSTAHGDLRVAHFFALHALQIFWAVGWLLGRSELQPRVGSWITAGFAAVYSAGVWLLLQQALAGRALLTMK